MTRRTNRAVEPLVEPLDSMADAAIALVSVTDEGLRGLAAAFSGVGLIAGRDGDPGPPGPPGETVKGDPGQDGAPGPSPIRSDVERNAFGMVDRVSQRLDDGSRRQYRVERDAAGRLLALVVSEVVSRESG
jgi:hypothetical protein